MKGLETTTENIIQQLENAISSGDVKNAQALVAILAKQKQLMKIDLIPRITADSGYFIKVIVEDRLSSAPPFLIKINSQSTAGELKKLVCLKYNFPVQVQRLIISQKIPKDRDVLFKHGVKEGSTVYIYMVPAYKLNLVKEQFQEELAQMRVFVDRPLPDGTLQSKPYLSMVNLDLSPLPVSGPKSGIVAAGSRQVFSSGTESVGASPFLAPTKPVEQEKIGWRCPCCTYINLPHRPGCEMCASNRPSDYQIPENYEMSPKEIDWWKMEDAAHKQILPPTITTRSLSPSLLPMLDHHHHHHHEQPEQIQ